MEVTPKGEVVWKFVNPGLNRGAVTPGPKPKDDEILGPCDKIPPGFLNMAFRVTRYSPYFPGFWGKNLHCYRKVKN